MDGTYAVWSLGVMLVIVAALLVLTALRNKALAELRGVLYDRHDVKLYLCLLENPRLRLLFSRRALESLAAEGRRVSKDKDGRSRA